MNRRIENTDEKPFTRHALVARTWARKAAKLLGYRPRYPKDSKEYPEVPAVWPNRAVRRAVKFGKTSRLPAEWREFLTARPEIRKAISTMP